MAIVLFDASTPTERPKIADGAIIYAGGDTPHVWTDDEITQFAEGFRLPCWVRSDPDNASAVADATAMLIWLQTHDVPTWVAVLLDLETAVNRPYVSGFCAILNAAKYYVLPYGSLSTLQQNPRCDGYVVALPGQAIIPDWADGVQYEFDGAYDLSEIRDTVPLWNTTPAPVPAPQPVERTNVQVQYPPLRGSVLIQNGAGNLVKTQIEGWDGSCPVSVVFDGNDGAPRMLTDYEWSADGRLDFWGVNGGPWGFTMWMAAAPTA